MTGVLVGRVSKIAHHHCNQSKYHCWACLDQKNWLIIQREHIMEQFRWLAVLICQYYHHSNTPIGDDSIDCAMVLISSVTGEWAASMDILSPLNVTETHLNIVATLFGVGYVFNYLHIHFILCITLLFWTLKIRLQTSILYERYTIDIMNTAAL